MILDSKFIERINLPSFAKFATLFDNLPYSFIKQKALEQHNKKSTEELKALFKYAQGAAHVWDVHEIGLARQERALQEKLEQSRQQHDNQNQVRQTW